VGDSRAQVAAARSAEAHRARRRPPRSEAGQTSASSRGDAEEAEVVKVIDFGIGKIAPGSAVDDGQELTAAGYMVGTFDYMSPEQIVGEPCEPASTCTRSASCSMSWSPASDRSRRPRRRRRWRRRC